MHRPVREPLSEVGKPETTVGIEDDIVRAVKEHAFAVRIKCLDLTVREVHTLNATALVIFGFTGGAPESVVDSPFETAVVADIAVPVRSNGGAIGTAPQLCDDARITTGLNSNQRARGDLHHEHAAVRQRDGSLRKLQTCRTNTSRQLQHGLFPSSRSSICGDCSHP